MTAKISNIHTGKVLGTFVGRPSQMADSIAFKISTTVKVSCDVRIAICTTSWCFLRVMTNSHNFDLSDCDSQAAMQSKTGSLVSHVLNL